MGMSATEYLSQLKALLPLGAALRAPAGSWLEALLAAWAEEFARVEAAGERLVAEADPRTAAELLPEWNRALGLPDGCTPAIQTLQEERETITARYAEEGDVTADGWIARALALGHSITLEEGRPSRCGVMQCGDELRPETAVFELRITAPTALTHPFEAGAAQAGDPLGAFDTDRLQCELRRIRQAHTALTFIFTT
ncbi:MAG TPA: putative phage tail protein [bacterium]|jgi:uncharacterized protein YmfQ (DUF2313 family)